MTFRREAWIVALAAASLAALFALSFVATPVKFLAADVPIAHLLAVGRVTFRASLAVEGILLLALLFATYGKMRWLTAAIAAILLGQWLVLMPQLDERTLARIAGAVLEPSSLHRWWIVLDVVRLALYALILRLAFRRLAARAGTGGLES